MILPFEHIRVFRRKEVIKPILVREDIGVLDTLIEVYSDHVGKKRGELDAVVSDCEYLGYDFKLVRGLASVLDSMSTFQSRSAIPPLEARRLVFKAAANHVIIGKEDRHHLLSNVAEKRGVTVDELDDSLYSDLESEQTLVDFNTVSPEELAHYYNYAHTVALLAYSTRIQMSYRGIDDHLERGFYGLGTEEPNYGSMKVVSLKPTNRLSRRSSKIDDVLSKLMEKEGWLLKADIKYPARYKTTCVYEFDSRGDGSIMKTEPVEDELIIEIPLVIKKKKQSKYGDIVVVDEVAEREGVTNGKILREIKAEGTEYKKLGGILVTPEKYEEISTSLKSVKTLGDAQSYAKSIGVRDFMQLIESFGYHVEWAKPRKTSKLYRL